MKSFKQSILLSLTVVLSLAVALHADSLAELPKDAPLIVVTKPITEINGALAAFMQSIGMPTESAVRVEDQLLGAMGLPLAMDPSRGFAMSIGDLKNAQETLLVLFPIQDARSAETAFSNHPMIQASGTQGIWQMDGGDGDVFYLKTAGDYMKMSSDKAFLSLPANKLGVTFSAADQKIRDASLVTMKMSLDKIVPQIESAFEAMKNQPGFAGNPGMVFMPWYLEQFKSLETLTLGGTLNVSGVTLSGVGKAKAGSALASALNGHPKANYADLSKLPNKEFTMACAMSMDPKAFTTLNNDVFGIMNQEAQESQRLSDEEIGQIKTLMEESLKYNANRGAFAQYVGPVGASMRPTDMMKMMGVFECKDAAALKASMLKAMPLLEKMLTQSMGLQMAYKENAGEAGGKSYDEITVDMSGMMAQMDDQTKAMMEQQWQGNMVVSEYLCFLPNNEMAFSLNPQDLETLLAFRGQAGADGLDRNPLITEAAKNLPSEANFYGFVNMGGYMRQMMQMQQGMNAPGAAMMMGMLGMMQGTIAASATLEDDSIQGTCVIPMSLIQNAAMMFMQMGMGGMDSGPMMMEEEVEIQSDETDTEPDQAP